MRGDPPQTKNIFVRVHRPKISHGQMGGREPPKGVKSTKCPTPKIFEPHFLENGTSDFFQSFRDQMVCQTLSTATAIFTSNNQKLCNNKKTKNFTWSNTKKKCVCVFQIVGVDHISFLQKNTLNRRARTLSIIAHNESFSSRVLINEHCFYSV